MNDIIYDSFIPQQFDDILINQRELWKKYRFWSRNRKKYRKFLKIEIHRDSFQFGRIT